MCHSTFSRRAQSLATYFLFARVRILLSILMYVMGNSYHIHKGASISDVLIQIRLCLLNLKDFTSSVHHCSPEYRPNPVLLPESLLRLPLRRYAAAFRQNGSLHNLSRIFLPISYTLCREFNIPAFCCQQIYRRNFYMDFCTVAQVCP